uniref:Uncharacterized protein n=1 Tax=Leersia perrieri TaxID=77586 RepID=A0A0D9WR01_9ORYZ
MNKFLKTIADWYRNNFTGAIFLVAIITAGVICMYCLEVANHRQSDASSRSKLWVSMPHHRLNQHLELVLTCMVYWDNDDAILQGNHITVGQRERNSVTRDANAIAPRQHGTK